MTTTERQPLRELEALDNLPPAKLMTVPIPVEEPGPEVILD